MADDQNAPQTDTDNQGKAPDAGGTQTPAPENKAAPEPSTSIDDLAPRQGETLEAYSARMKGEVGWRDKQIGRQHRQKKEADEKLTKAAEIEAENTRLKELAEASNRKPADNRQVQPAPTPPPSKPGVDPGLLAQARFQVAMERVSEELGKHAEWTSAAQNYEKAGGIPPDFMQAVLDTDDPTHVLITLGKDMNRYQQILDLPEGRRRAALIKLGMEPGQAAPAAPVPAPKKPSSAPTPTGGGLPAGGSAPQEGGFDPDADCRVAPDQWGKTQGKFSEDQYDAEWYRKRAEQKRNSQGRPWSYGGKVGAGQRG